MAIEDGNPDEDFLGLGEKKPVSDKDIDKGNINWGKDKNPKIPTPLNPIPNVNNGQIK